MDDQEKEENKRALDNALAQQRLEGLEVTPETVQELARVASGETTIPKVIRVLHQRYDHTRALDI
jgi:hypothetical protein